MPAIRLVIASCFLCAGIPALAQTTISASSADTIIEGAQTTGTFGLHVAGAGDIDGDGYSDVLIGDPGYDGAYVDSGRIAFHRGSPAGLGQTPAWTLEGSAAGAQLYRAYPAGDVNGDGFDDVLVQIGTMVSLYLGSAAGPAPSPGWSRAGTPVGHGDVNGDGYADVAVRAHPDIAVFHGSASGLGTTPATIVPLPTSHLSPRYLDSGILQDLNADGYDDLGFTWRYCATDCLYLVGELRIHLGSRKGLDPQAKVTFDFRRAQSEAMPFIAPTGDVDGDRFGDLVLRVYPDPAGGGPNSILLLRGSRSGLRIRSAGAIQQLVPPGSVNLDDRPDGEGAGDVNGDGFADLLLPDYAQADYRTLFVYAGGPGGLVETPLLVVEPEQTTDLFAHAVSRAGDLNGDGYGDLVASAPDYTSGGLPVGRVYVFLGRASY